MAQHTLRRAGGRGVARSLPYLYDPDIYREEYWSRCFSGRPELDSKNETVGQCSPAPTQRRSAREQDMKQIRKKHGATFKILWGVGSGRRLPE